MERVGEAGNAGDGGPRSGLGPEHPDSLAIMANVAYTLCPQEKLREVIVLIEKCVKLYNSPWTVLSAHHQLRALSGGVESKSQFVH
ncbi:hypothetical protein BDV27DRAFT_34482 [Aspergillus caelatus]|uniref:Uncharacterized protein n=1 Tax=Aspergillus caelatus TaxID=61420 RepID=A0A5N6ZTX3_9EURO|nr:uncharacterized protein BDV27DRAFT_34482 [Aspergillus caelatus]KAE8360848.1 hypothetical protein BDV27DRAFT_34482 [Aspergillus caelatus]